MVVCRVFTRTPHGRATPIEIDFDHEIDFDTELLRVENKNALQGKGGRERVRIWKVSL
jgi:hypothetical protein